jgi:hypothetical protein
MIKKTALRTINGIDLEMGSGNEFADLDLLLSRWGNGPGDRLISTAEARPRH